VACGRAAQINDENVLELQLHNVLASSEQSKMPLRRALTRLYCIRTRTPENGQDTFRLNETI